MPGIWSPSQPDKEWIRLTAGQWRPLTRGITLETGLGASLDVLALGIRTETYNDRPTIQAGSIDNTTRGQFTIIQSKSVSLTAGTTNDAALAINTGATNLSAIAGTGSTSVIAPETSAFTAISPTATESVSAPVDPIYTGKTATEIAYEQGLGPAYQAQLQSGGSGTGSYANAVTQSTSQAGPYTPNPVYSPYQPVVQTATQTYQTYTPPPPSYSQNTTSQSSQISQTVPAPPAPSQEDSANYAIQSAQDALNNLFNFGF